MISVSQRASFLGNETLLFGVKLSKLVRSRKSKYEEGSTPTT